MDKLVKEETEKVQRSFDNQLADLQAKQAAAPQVSEPVVNEQTSNTEVDVTPVSGSRIDRYVKPRVNEEEQNKEETLSLSFFNKTVISAIYLTDITVFSQI